MTHFKKRLLYFDIDGTILDKSSKAVKKNLQDGQLELKIREANFDKIYCVGNVNDIFQGLDKMGQHVDSVEIVYTLCFDAFTDFDWFMNYVCCTKNPDQRIKQIQFSEDWWYMDEMAGHYLKKGGKSEILKRQQGNRILIPKPNGDGEDIINWFEIHAIPAYY
jgi:hypothetical protein